MYYETKLRSVVKTVSWRFVATITTMVLVYVFIGDLTIALSVGSVEIFLKMFVYFLHERGWDKIKFGKKQINPAVIWLTGLAKSGKKEIALELQYILKARGYRTEFIDGHSIRSLIHDTGFEPEQVNAHIERIGYLAKKLEDQGIFVIASFLSPYEKSRNTVRKICNNFHEVYVSTPLEICIERDESGVYERAKKGEIKNLPGIDVKYELPKNPDVEVDISKINPEAAAKIIFGKVSITF